ncbi:high choriolytic enzyme 1-like [Mizuhopecten yessoensis]|uniref:Metalloendopeptidase n=1 Tax=Mizuhopecten yessoensis TaxID=6573 RepID=A0A210PIY8_MIZYE|nr:high choriolytic enzyme 1-like [Mizuhopecten yessoensis]OWF36457.1 Zinc metalloproteinase nas-4 [Mizuhopecten yessoensis]
MRLPFFFIVLIYLWPDLTTSQDTSLGQESQPELLQQLLQQLQQTSPQTIDQEILNAAGPEAFNSDVSDPIHQEFKIQGDIVFKYGELAGALQPEPAVHGGLVRKKRKTPQDLTKMWPNAEVLIAFDSRASFSPEERSLFQSALEQWQRKTCVRFRTPTINDIHQGRSFIFVQDGKGCSSPLGMNPMRETGIFKYQPLTLARPCRTRRIMMHEVGHSLGLIHEQSRSDRDSSVNVMWQNVPVHMRHNFQKFTEQVTNNRNTPYDYESLMHYGPNAFTTNGAPTLRTLDASYQDRIGGFQEISRYDAMAISNMYNCGARMQPFIPPWWHRLLGRKKK